MSITYAIKRVLKMDFSRVGKDIARVAKKANKSKAYILFDMFFCGVKYGAGPLDYDLFEFYNLNTKQRKTYVTRGVNNALVKKFNRRDKWYIFDNKNDFNTLFCDFIIRDWLYTENLDKSDFFRFCENKDGFIYKPKDGTCGRGIEKIMFDGRTFDDIYDDIMQKPFGIIEQIVVQNSEISKVYPLAINTVRVVTINDGESVTPVFAFWRIGNNGKFVDNLNSGGMAAILDIENGKVTLPAADKDGITYTKHPYTNTDIVGFTIPMWDTIIKTVTAAAKVCPEVGYVGWDIALSEDSVQIIEGNCFPGHDILQLPAYTPDKIGLMPRVERFLK